jgi:hypothetical protein
VLVLTLQLPVAPVPVQVLFLLQEQVSLELLVRLKCYPSLHLLDDKIVQSELDHTTGHLH